MPSLSGGRGRNESPTVQLSKALSYILRHGTAKEGLTVSPDGFVALDAVLRRPKVSKVRMDDDGRAPNESDIRALVESNDKKRFELKADEGGLFKIRAVQGHSIAQVTELDHVILRLDNLHVLATAGAENNKAAEARLPDGVEILHGTSYEAWQKIKESGGLSRMKRNHIHLAKARPGEDVVSGMRASSPVILHIDMISAIRQGIPFQMASNGAILTQGKDSTGILPIEFITRAEDSKTGDDLYLA